MIDVHKAMVSLGINGRVSGKEFQAHCPMHRQRTGRDDTSPSWSINLKTGLHHCFSCGYKGTVQQLAADLGVAIDDVRVVQPISQSSRRIVLPDLTQVITGHAYLDESVLGRFTTPPNWALEQRRVSPEACEYYEVMWDGLEDSWILLIRDPWNGRLMGWQSKSQTSRRFLNYPTGVKKSRTLFGYTRFDSDQMIVVESPLDAVRMYTEGVRGAVACFGAVVSKQQISLMAAADEVVFALDNPRIDEAGKKSSLALLKETKGMLKSVRFFDYRGIDAKDPGDMTGDQIRAGINTSRSRAYGMAAIA